MRTTLVNGTPVEVTREAGRGGDIIAIREVSVNPTTGELVVVQPIFGCYVGHVTPALLGTGGVALRPADVAATLALAAGE